VNCLKALIPILTTMNAPRIGAATGTIAAIASIPFPAIVVIAVVIAVVTSATVEVVSARTGIEEPPRIKPYIMKPP
jgi:hypothetical protein